MLKLVCVGKLRESYFADAVKEYEKRLTRLHPIKIVELPDEKEPAVPSEALCEQAMRKEGERILRAIAPHEYVIAMCIRAKQHSSEALAAKLSELFVSGRSDVTFVIGGSLGLSGAVIERADERMSMSDMTFPHQLARVMLMEQLYRACKINAGERYHK